MLFLRSLVTNVALLRSNAAREKVKIMRACACAAPVSTRCQPPGLRQPEARGAVAADSGGGRVAQRRPEPRSHTGPQLAPTRPAPD